jgi:hypothetical protein
MSVTQRCAHPQAVPVESDGKTVAVLCPDCDRQLPAAWLTCPHENTVDAPMFGERPPHLRICSDCGGEYWPSEEA